MYPDTGILYDWRFGLLNFAASLSFPSGLATRVNLTLKPLEL